jgi:hypothetical protein
MRTTGIGLANGVGRLAGIIMPWICGALQSNYILNSYILFAILSFMSILSSFLLPFDTTG